MAQAARRQPMLSPEEERQLALRARTGDEDAANRLIASHLRFVISLARRYRRYGLPLDDLVQEGTIGLIQAVRRFDPERNVRLATYAMWWIRAAMQEHVVRSWSVVRLGTTATQRALFFRLGRMREGSWPSGERLSEDVVGALAQRFGLSVGEVVGFARRAMRLDRSLNQPLHEDRTEEWIDQLSDDRPNPEEALAVSADLRRLRGLLAQGLTMLPPREQFIIRHRYLAEARLTFEGIGRELGLSRERVRQLERAALDRLRKALDAICGRDDLPELGGA